MKGVEWRYVFGWKLKNREYRTLNVYSYCIQMYPYNENETAA